MAYNETQRKIVYDILKQFQGGRVTDDSKVSERFVEDKLHDHRNAAIINYFTSGKVKTRFIDNAWFQDYVAEFDKDLQESEANYTVFEIPKILNMPRGAGLMYAGTEGGAEQIPTVSSTAMLNSYLSHRDTRKQTLAHFMAPNRLRVFNLSSPDSIMVRAVFERPPEVHIFGKGLTPNEELLELENFRDQEYYPLSGGLLMQAKQSLLKDLQVAFQMPVDRQTDSRQSTDYQGTESES